MKIHHFGVPWLPCNHHAILIINGNFKVLVEVKFSRISNNSTRISKGQDDNWPLGGVLEAEVIASVKQPRPFSRVFVTRGRLYDQVPRRL